MVMISILNIFLVLFWILNIQILSPVFSWGHILFLALVSVISRTIIMIKDNNLLIQNRIFGYIKNLWRGSVTFLDLAMMDIMQVVR